MKLKLSLDVDIEQPVISGENRLVIDNAESLYEQWEMLTPNEREKFEDMQQFVDRYASSLPEAERQLIAIVLDIKIQVSKAQRIAHEMSPEMTDDEG